MTELTIREKLQMPFDPSDIEWRIQQAGIKPMQGADGWAMVLAYVTNRAIQERLDDVFGIENWRNEFKQAPDGGTLCGIAIRFGQEWVTKWDGAENTQVEAVKGGLSSAMKRAGVQWGVGRYLYNLESNFVKLYSDRNEHTESYYHKETKKKYFWSPPALPKWAQPTNGEGKR